MLFVGTKNGSRYVAGSTLTFGAGDYALSDLSYASPPTYTGTLLHP